MRDDDGLLRPEFSIRLIKAELLKAQKASDNKNSGAAKGVAS